MPDYLIGALYLFTFVFKQALNRSGLTYWLISEMNKGITSN